MATTWNTRTVPSTSWSWRTPPNTTWSNKRLWGAYLVDVNGDYILTMNWERIIILVPWWTLQTTSWNTRIIP